MIIRVRTNVGIWRVEVSESDATPESILNEISRSRPNVVYEKDLSQDPGCTQPLMKFSSLESQGIRHGSMVYTRVDASTCALSDASEVPPDLNTTTTTTTKSTSLSSSDASTSSNTKRIIAADGSIKLIHSDKGKDASNAGFRKGMLPLRDMKMHWTLQEFTDMDDKFVFKIKRQEERWVGSGGVSLDSESANSFQSYLRTFQFARQRFGLLYGKFVDEEEEERDEEEKKRMEARKKMGFPVDEKLTKKKNKKVIVEAIYEPPQEADPNTPEGFIPLEDDMEERVDQLAKSLGLQRVGWIYGHPPREKGFQMSAAEVLAAAEYQLEAAGGIETTPFVTIKVTVGDDGNVSFEAFQVSLQCMSMVAEGAIEVGPDPGFCYINDTFTAIQEGKESKTVENNFFLTVVPIVQHSSETFVSKFPMANRDLDTRMQSHDEMKKQLSQSGSAGWTFLDLLADFNLLIYLSKFMDPDSDMPRICESIVNRDIPLYEGYRLIIASMAGLDSSY
mmetsp:Transcript_8010/g.11434  ORF Transcript_8010/g.11434 Transcript_8010/m.11434 type:complete len:505 (+) Transcript_8010:57-1571(+)